MMRSMFVHFERYRWRLLASRLALGRQTLPPSPGGRRARGRAPEAPSRPRAPVSGSRERRSAAPEGSRALVDDDLHDWRVRRCLRRPAQRQQRRARSRRWRPASGSPATTPTKRTCRPTASRWPSPVLDVAYSGEKFGATISLRFGPGVNRFYAATPGPLRHRQHHAGLRDLEARSSGSRSTSASSTRSTAPRSLESWSNVNYSRGALYYAMQPFWHTGLRANYAINDKFGVNAMIVNGVNNAFENNKSPTLGLQARRHAHRRAVRGASVTWVRSIRATDGETWRR